MKIQVVKNQWVDFQGGVVATFVNEDVARLVWESFSQSDADLDEALELMYEVES